MRYTGGFLRVSPAGKHVGVLKYKDPEGRWRQVTRTFTESREESAQMFDRWRASMGAVASTPAPMPGAWPTPTAAPARASGAWPAPAAARAPGAGPTPGTETTVEEFVRKCLASQLARGRIERSTHDAQLSCAERHLFPELGSEPMAGLGPARIQDWIDGLCLRVSRGTARAAFSVLGKSLRAAERAGLVERNPMALVDRPARKPPARSYLPPDQASALLSAASREWGPASPLSCAVQLALYAGLRAGECCGLRWRDVGERALRVTAAVGRSDDGCYLKGPKSASGARDVPLTAPLKGALGARARETGRKPEWFVCGDGRDFADPRRLSIAFKDLCEKEGISDSDGRRATFHALRRTFATEAVRAGVDARTLADLMGHAGADVTLNVYAASGGDAKAAAAARLEDAFERIWEPVPARSPG